MNSQIRVQIINPFDFEVKMAASALVNSNLIKDSITQREKSTQLLIASRTVLLDILNKAMEFEYHVTLQETEDLTSDAISKVQTYFERVEQLSSTLAELEEELRVVQDDRYIAEEAVVRAQDEYNAHVKEQQEYNTRAARA